MSLDSTIPIPRDFLIEVQKGNVPGHSLVHKFGRNFAVPNNSWEFINSLGFTVWPLSAATTVRVKAGGDVNDGVGGTGAREITVQGIDDSLNEITETITTAGIAASAVTTALFWRVHRAWVSSNGTYGGANIASVVVENGTGGTDLIEITIQKGQTEFGAWSVPTGKTAYLLSATVQVDSGKTANIRMFTRKNFNDTTVPVESNRMKLFFDGVIGQFTYAPRSPSAAIAALTDIWWEALGDGAVSQVSVDFELLVVDT